MTAEPTASLLKREVMVVAKGDAKEFAAMLKREHRDHVVLVVGHTDTLPGIIDAMGHATPVKIESGDYGNVFVLTPRADGPPGFLVLRY